MARLQQSDFGIDKFILLAVLGMVFGKTDFGLFLMLDWLLDRMRTLVNTVLPERAIGGETIQNFQELQQFDFGIDKFSLLAVLAMQDFKRKNRFPRKVVA